MADGRAQFHDGLVVVARAILAQQRLCERA